MYIYIYYKRYLGNPVSMDARPSYDWITGDVTWEMTYGGWHADDFIVARNRAVAFMQSVCAAFPMCRIVLCRFVSAVCRLTASKWRSGDRRRSSLVHGVFGNSNWRDVALGILDLVHSLLTLLQDCDMGITATAVLATTTASLGEEKKCHDHV